MITPHTSAARALFGTDVGCRHIRRAQRRRAVDQFLLALNDLGGEPQVGFAADALEVIDQHRLAERRRLRNAHVARDYGVVDLLSAVLPDVRDHLVGQVVARIVHRQHDPVDDQRRMQARANFLNSFK